MKPFPIACAPILSAVVGCALLSGCEAPNAAFSPGAATPSPGPVAPPPPPHPVEVDGARDAGLRRIAAKDLHCDSAALRTELVPLHRDHLYIVDGCDQRAVYAPRYTWPGPDEEGFILLAISKRPP
jgi:hypothetical protein